MFRSRQRPQPIWRPRAFRPRLDVLEHRLVPSAFWGGFAGTGQHTADAPVASQPLNQVLWQTPVDLSPQGGGIHYGSPLVTQANTVITPVKVGASNGFKVEGHSGAGGATLWTESSDYLLPPAVSAGP